MVFIILNKVNVFAVHTLMANIANMVSIYNKILSKNKQKKVF